MRRVATLRRQVATQEARMRHADADTDASFDALANAEAVPRDEVLLARARADSRIADALFAHWLERRRELFFSFD